MIGILNRGSTISNPKAKLVEARLNSYKDAVDFPEDQPLFSLRVSRMIFKSNWK